MPDDTSPIQYASPGLAELPADRLLRRIVAWTAIAYGANALARTALHVVLAKGWAAAPPNMSWSLEGGWNTAVFLVQSAAMAALVAGGVLALRRSRACVAVLRGSVACWVLLSVVGLAMLVRTNPTYASYWSTPAAAAVNAAHFLEGLCLPVLILLLTLPLARRMF